MDSNRFGDVSDIADQGSPQHDELPGQVASQQELERMQAFIEANAVRTGIVTTLVMPEGDVVDCVERDEQPALLRADMRDHRLQLRPNVEPSMEGSEAQDDALPLGQRVVQTYGTLTPVCPDATVPIRRLTLDTLVRFRTLDDFLSKVPGDAGHGSDLYLPDRDEPSLDLPEQGPGDRHQYAIVLRVVDNWGAESVLNLWRPYTELAKEFTLSQIWVSRGGGASLETVEGGWQKYRNLYGDWNSRLFVYFTPDNYGDGGCYNLSCSKFVQVNNSVYIGGAFDQYSADNGDQRIVKLLWYKDGPEGHWWLRYFDTWVGYYPRNLFDNAGLQDQGARVDFGGEITNYETDGRHTRTDMGSGFWPYQGFRKSAYQRTVRYVDTDNFYRRATGLTSSTTDRDCYDLDLESSSGAWEEYFYFGGSGYNTQCE